MRSGFDEHPLPCLLYGVPPTATIDADVSQDPDPIGQAYSLIRQDRAGAFRALQWLCSLDDLRHALRLLDRQRIHRLDHRGPQGGDIILREFPSEYLLGRYLGFWPIDPRK